MRRPAPTTLAILAALLLAGCSPFYVDWDNGTIREAPEIEQSAIPATSRSNDTLTPHRQALLHPHKHKQPAASPADVEEMTIEPDSTGSSAASAPAATATISMASPGGNSGNAEKAIAAAGDRLARFNRGRLKGPTLSTYDEANGFLNQGKQALAEKDFVAAAGFAQKASALADRLQEATVTSR
ncbi:MAG TPA: hypothetical protein VKV03_02975 [Candidatus Binataceae bacterium]|nr:hypothetical protein [Candidatus Binataceae bacterium]